MNSFSLLISRIKILLKKAYRLNKINAKVIEYPTLRLGSKYGGWCIPKNLLTNKSICYLAGAGEDISFDLSLSQKFKCIVNIYDPTPKSFEHFNKLKTNTRNGIKTPVNNRSNDFYNGDIESLNRLQFFQIGIWNKNEKVKFFSPEKLHDVSHSIQNLQNTNNYFLGEVCKLSTILKTNNHIKIDLLKLDIEGSEYDVIDEIINENIKISCLCIEFHAENNNYNKKSISKINDYLNKLISLGYSLIDIDYSFNVTLINKNILTN